MGCFSYLCKECGKGINSTSFSGENVRISLLVKGKIVEEMQGPYDSYGRVFGYEWNMDWGKAVDLQFGDDISSGFHAVHVACLSDKKPTTRSEDDPDQGWNRIKKKHTGKCIEYHKIGMDEIED